ncbi:MAG: winged helix DNA-binding domain-containing protein, partial [Acidimicrobiia bacterium]|nr:winged helix DNA-binding domain-containing protein [Acidimicrobiia bacterium]
DTAVDAHAASTQPIAARERIRTMKAFGWTQEFMEDAMDDLVDLIARIGPLTTREIGELRPSLTERVTVGEGTRNPAAIPAHTRLLLHAGFEARIVRGRPSGTWISSEYAWNETVAWLGRPIAGGEPRPAAAAIVRRWLEAFGPGTETDLRWWTGWTAAQLREALADVGAVEVDLDDGSSGYVLESDRGDIEEAEPWVALLPGLDPTAMGWKERGWYLDDATARRVVDRNGNIGPTIWADGEVVGGWLQRPDGTIAQELDRPVSAEHRRLLETEIERLTDVLGDSRFRTRFPAPNQADLLA